jgi:hypothetical protein
MPLHLFQPNRGRQIGFAHCASVERFSESQNKFSLEPYLDDVGLCATVAPRARASLDVAFLDKSL